MSYAIHFSCFMAYISLGNLRYLSRIATKASHYAISASSNPTAYFS